MNTLTALISELNEFMYALAYVCAKKDRQGNGSRHTKYDWGSL